MICTMPVSPDDIQNQIVEEFEAFKDWDERYKHIIDLGKALPEFPEEARTEDNIVKGCQSQVWMIADLQDGNMVIKADSDAMIVRGLVSLVLRLYSGQPPAVVLQTKPEFIERINMGQHLSMQRSNGLAAMIKQIQFYALAFQAKVAAGL